MLLQKAKVITTPTAYSDGFLHSVKPNVVYSEDLVANGDFSNGITGWSGSATVIDSQLIKTSGGLAYQIISGVSGGGLYKIVVNVELSLSNLKLYVGGTQIDLPEGVNTFYVTSGGSNDFVGFNNGYDTGTSTGSIINSIQVFEDISADFTFTRNSSATRVGEDGYIQDVQIIGGELVQNGDFEEIGSELVTNGSFDTDSDWILENGAVINNGSVNIIGVGSRFRQDVLTVGKLYKLQYKVISTNGELFRFQDGTTAFSDINQTIGSHTYYFKATGVRVQFQAVGDVDARIDNVSVKEVGQNWTFVGDFETDGTKVFITTASQYSQLTNQIGVNYLLSGRKYRLSFDIPTLSISNAFAYRYTGGSVVPISTSDIQNGRFTTDFVMPSDGYFWLQTTGSYTGLNVEVDNISVKEVTDDTNLPRINYEGFDYDNGLPIYGSGKGHLLLEGQSTNLMPYSEDFSEWTIQTNSIVTSNSTISPDGTQNATKLSAGTSVARQSIVYNVVNSGDFFYSVFAKKGEYDVIQLTDAINASRYANFDLNNGVVGSYDVCTPSIEDYGNGWFRCVMAFTQVGLNTVRISIAESPTQARLVDFAGNGSDGIYIWGAMVEKDNLSSYIPTNGSAVTRAAETCNNAGNADLFDSEGVLYAEIAALANDGTFREITINDGTSSNAVEIRYSLTSNEIQYVVRSGGAIQVVEVFALDNALEFNKFAARYKENDFSLFVNGVQVITDTSGIEPVGLSKLHFFFAGGNNFYGKTKMVAVFPYLSNDEMECLTSEGYGSFEAMALANNYTIIQG